MEKEMIFMGSTSPQDNILNSGTVLKDRYVVKNMISKSSVSRMYLGKDNQKERELAIKELLIEDILNPAEKKEAVEQFQVEARILLRLYHPNLPKFEDYFEFEGRRYLIMEYIKGDKLSNIVKDTEGFLNQGQVLKWAIELCDVLEYLHSRKPNPIIFRGLCPDNLILSTDGKLKLIDFGISKIFDPKSRTLAVAKTAKMYYSPMEQYVSRTDERTDIYSLGATLYYFLTKEVPVDAVDRTLDGIELPTCVKFNPGVNSRFEDIVFKAVALEQENRYPDVTTMKKELEQLKDVLLKDQLTEADRKHKAKEDAHIIKEQVKAKLKQEEDLEKKLEQEEEKVFDKEDFKKQKDSKKVFDKEEIETAPKKEKKGFIERMLDGIIRFFQNWKSRY